MESPIDFPVNPVGTEGGHRRAALTLDFQRYQDMRWCANCAGEQIFLPVYECEAGRVGVCLGCGDERIAPFTRVNSEVA